MTEPETLDYQKLTFGIVALLGVAAPILLSVMNRTFQKATLLEKEGKVKEACYQYALAILGDSISKNVCKEKIKGLWQQYGPYDFSDELETLHLQGKLTKKSEARHSRAVMLIQEIVSAKK